MSYEAKAVVDCFRLGYLLESLSLVGDGKTREWRHLDPSLAP